MSAELFLVGCGSAAPVGEGASAQTMGFKAWNLLRMAQLGLPVPPAYVLGSRLCQVEAAQRRAAAQTLSKAGLRALEEASGLALGDARRPLLLSVRSGAAVSMPGMMDTLLDIGLCEATVGGLLRQSGNPRMVWDAYRRLVAGYGEVVAGVAPQVFEQAQASIAADLDERELDFYELRELTRLYLRVYEQAARRPFPQSPHEQLQGAIGAVFDSWQSERARAYRRIHGLPGDLGTAVTVQRMVFGNAGGHSGAGVGFSRDPSSGMPELWVDFLFDAQGEDVVSGRRNAYGHEQLMVPAK
jgi:pyruvate,orthophosphate dikinase